MSNIQELQKQVIALLHGDDRVEINKLIEKSNNLLQETQNYYPHE